jgi:hypothetical protein
MRIALILGVAISYSHLTAIAANDTWDNNLGGNWENNANWADGTAPGINDSATFNLAQTYAVSFANEPSVIQALSASAGTVTLQSSGGAKTLNLTAGAGSQDVIVSGASTTLTLGTSDNPLHLNAGDDLSIRTGATLAVLFGSDVVANDLSATGLNGTLRIDGSGSTLTLGGNIVNLVGATGTGSLVFQNGSTGNTINSSLALASSATPSVTGNLSILSGAALTLGGNLTLANQNVASQVGGISIQGTNSALSQSGAATITAGSAVSGTATIAIGTTTSGGSLTTGTGLFTINKTGTVTIGSGANVGTLLANGDLTINGGVLQKMNVTSTLDLAAGKTVTIQSGGRLTLAGPNAADSNQIFNVSGTNSRLEITGANAFSIGSGAQVNLTSGAVLSAGGRIDVASGAGSGTLTVAGTGSTATGGSELSMWASGGGTANVTFSSGAAGTFTAGLDLANSTAAGTTAVVNVLSNADLSVGNLNLATSGGTTTSATLNINGTDSSVVQTGAATLTIGHASEGTAAANIGTANDGGTLTTGSGLFTINKTGTVTIGNGEKGGTLEVLGNITVDGGVLQEGGIMSTFAWATGKTLAIQNGGRVHFATSYTTAASSQHFVSGANSTFDVAGAVHIRNGSQVNVNSGASIVASQFNVGGGGAAGTLTVDGNGSMATGGSEANHWGSGGAATVTLSNQAMATLGGSVSLAESATTLVNVLSGADLTTGDLSLASIGGTAAATLNVLGIGSTVTVSPSSDLVVGHATNGTATINLEDGGSLTVDSGSSTTVLGSGIINLNSGTANLRAVAVVGGTINVGGGKLAFTTLSVGGGTINFSAGRVEQTNNLTADESLLTILFGPTHELAIARTLAAGGGTASLSANLDLNGGRLEGNSLNVINAGLNATVLRIRNGGTAQFTADTTLAAGTTTSVEDGGSLIAGGQLIQASEMQLTGTGRVAGAALANSGLVTGSGRIDANLNNQSTGQVRIDTDQRLLLRGGSHQNNGLIDINGGELEVATGVFVNGTANPATATIAARHATLRFSGGITNAGSIICSEGTCDVFGDVTNASNSPTIGRIVITANSQATFFDDVVNQGTIQVSAAGLVESTALFLSSLSGNGVTGSGSVFLEGEVRPGASTATMAFGGDVSIGSSAVLKMELAGAVPGGQFDRITVEQSLALAGTLEVSLTAGFTPSAGQSFDLIDWGSLGGTFTSINLPALAGLSWNTSQLYTNGVVSVTAGLAGDYNGNGTVDAADYSVWRDGLGAIYTQADYDVWKSHFGQSAGGGSSQTAAVPAAPEPAALTLMLIAVMNLQLMFGRSARLIRIICGFH